MCIVRDVENERAGWNQQVRQLKVLKNIIKIQ